jgi:hypothetical protein
MEAVLMEKDLTSLAILDTFDSFIWTDRYCGLGDFEILTPVSSRIVSYLTKDRYLSIKESIHTMIIETLSIKSDIETGNKIRVKGSSLESILKRRIIWDQTILTGNFQNEIHRLLDENAINPSDSNRGISNFEFVESTDPSILDLEIEAQYRGDILYDVIEKLCLSAGLGFKITISEAGIFEFQLYSGTDRSYDQLTNPYVVFSPSFENIINGEYTETNVDLKTVSLVAGERGIGNERTTTVVEVSEGAGTDLDRREMFSDAADIMRNVSGEEPMTEEDYLLQLTQKGMDDLSKKTIAKNFEGQVEATRMYVYGEDFFMGDIVQVENEYGNEAKSRVIELIISQDLSGYKTYPTFSAFS